MNNPLIMKLEQFTSFSDEGRRRLDGLIEGKRRTWTARQDLLREGDRPDEILVVLTGMAARYKDLTNGERQITAFLVPGDLCDVEVFVLDRMDHGITALTETKCAIVPADQMRELLTDMRGLTEALWWSTMTDIAVLRERIVDHGRRGARERLAHLFYELLIRNRIVGLAHGDSFSLPMTQQELGEAMGLTSVHVNRMMQELRAEGLIEHRGKMLTVKDPARLKAVARFSSSYLHLRRAEAGEQPAEARVHGLL